MTSSVKNLHMATNLQDLKKQAGIQSLSFNINGRKIENITKSAAKLFESAKTAMAEKEEDEEQVYTFLFRSFELWILASSSEEWKKDQTYYKLMYSKVIQKCWDLLNIYTIKLEKRYEKQLDHFQINSSITVKKMKGAEDKLNGKILNGTKSSNKTTKERADEFDKFDIKMIPQSLNPTENMDYYGDKKFIECPELKELILENSSDVLILDIRPKQDFAMSKIVKAHNINIPESSITAGLSAHKLAWQITNENEKTSWEAREQYRQLVLLDWHSETKDVIPNNPLSNLLNILLKWDPDVIYKNPPLILNGGFEKWLDMYPTLTTNPNIQCPPKPVVDPFIHFNEHNIEYPIGDLEDNISARPKSVPKSAVPEVHKPLHIPTVDRTTKPSSLAKTDSSEYGLASTKDADSTNSSSKMELMEDETSVSDKNDHTSTRSSIPEPNIIQQPVRPVTPPRPLEKSYPTTPKRTSEKGEGDGEFSIEKLKVGSSHSSGGLKRSSSSPNINKMFGDDTITPVFDRSTKPKPSINFDNYSSRGGHMDTVYLTHGKKGRGLTGLKNLGNLCYMNSIMQCISNTVDLMQVLTRFNVNEVNTKRQIASEVSMLLRVLWQGDTRVYTCRDLKSRVGSLKPAFSTSEQQDSHEFLTILMDWLHEDLNGPSNIISLSGADESTGEKAWGEFKKKNNSCILDLFYGQLKSTVTCTHCQKQSVLFEPFSNLSIPLPANQDAPYEKDRRYTLQDCLKLYLTGETISGWVCPACKTPREATKKLDITRLPPVLIIHLKRFMTDMVGVGWCRKRMNMVDFPINDFNMAPFTHPSSELRNYSYNLYAVSNHYGSMESGHYTAYCKNYLLNKWYKFDDQDVSEISPSDVKSSAAYILFYESSNSERNNSHMD